MSETVLFNLITYGITALVTVLLAAIAAWRTAKLGAHSGAVEAMEPVQKQLDVNAGKMDRTARVMESIHNQSNSQLDDFKALLKDEAAKAIAAAVKEGIAQGIELERTRRESMEKERILAEAQAEAKLKGNK